MTDREPEDTSGKTNPRDAEDNKGDSPADESDDRRTRNWRDELGDLAVSLLGEERLKDLGDVRKRAERAADVAAAGHLDDLRLIEKAEFHRSRRDKAREDYLDPKSKHAAEAGRRVQHSVERLGGFRLLRDVTVGSVDLSKDDSKDKLAD